MHPNMNIGKYQPPIRIFSSLVFIHWWTRLWGSRWQPVRGSAAAGIWACACLAILCWVAVAPAVTIYTGPHITKGTGVVHWPISCSIECRSPIFARTTSSWAALCKTAEFQCVDSSNTENILMEMKRWIIWCLKKEFLDEGKKTLTTISEVQNIVVLWMSRNMLPGGLGTLKLAQSHPPKEGCLVSPLGL